jgi:hypothetical protein
MKLFKSTLLLFLSSVLLYFNSCQNQQDGRNPNDRVGGPCEYSPFSREATVIKIDTLEYELLVVFQFTFTEETITTSYKRFFSSNTSLSELDTPRISINTPATIEGMQITEGTCKSMVVNNIILSK